MDGDPGTRKDSDKRTPHNIPDATTVCEVGAMIYPQRAVVNGWDGTPVNRGSLDQVVDKDDKQHSEGQARKGD